MGTKIYDLPVERVSDGDTIAVIYQDKVEKLRLALLDTEECKQGSNKPVTRGGQLAYAYALKYFTREDGQFYHVDLEFDTDDPLEVCLSKHRGNYGRLVCYVHRAGDNYNLRMIREGWSPYFVKYGQSRIYHKEMQEAEALAQQEGLGIWNPATNAETEQRDYQTLLPWWKKRGEAVESYRQQGIKAGILSIRLHYDQILKAAENQEEITILIDLQKGIDRWLNDQALIFSGSKYHRMSIWIPDIYHKEAQDVIRLIKERYAEYGKGYAYIRGKTKMYKGRPELVLTSARQIRDVD